MHHSFSLRAALCSFVLLASASACATVDDRDSSAPLACDSVPKDAPDRDMLLAIDAMGLCGSSAVDVGDAYVVEGDIRIEKSALSDKQARTSSLVSTANIRDITVRVDSSIPVEGGVDDWRVAVQDAIAAWNAVPFNLVRMTLVTTSSADITFRSDAFQLPDNTAAESEFPASGNPGANVRVNLDFTFNDQTLVHDQKLFLAVHELGHCIGLRHTNWRIFDQGSPSAIDIPGTPTTDIDSVMNAGTAGHDFFGLSPNDELAIRTVYPEIVSLLVEYTGCTNGTPRMAATWGGTLVQPTLEWQLERYVGSSWSEVYRGTGISKTFNIPTGAQLKLRLRGHSAEGWSLYRTVTKTAPTCSTLPQ